MSPVRETSASAGWNFRADLDWNGTVNVIDLSRESSYIENTPPPATCNSENVATYTYDGNGTQLKRTLDDGSWTVYVGGVFEKTNTGAVRKYYQAFGRTIAVRDGGTVRFMLQDHLGSTTELLDTAGATVANSEIAYWPYGGTREGGVTGTDLLYTGQRQEAADAGMGLYNYKARFYSTALGRFVSADPIVGAVADPQSWNPYSYVLNNPLGYVDPTGKYFEKPGDAAPPCWVCAALIQLASRGLDSPAKINGAQTACAQACADLRALASVGWTQAEWDIWKFAELTPLSRTPRLLAGASREGSPGWPRRGTRKSSGSRRSSWCGCVSSQSPASHRISASPTRRCATGSGKLTSMRAAARA
jgi:RHS repeat-associated protein